MRPDLSAFEILGLAPDASQGDIEAAYRRLIKQYHPDRSGGDAVRATELNRAYRQLRDRPPRDTAEIAVSPSIGRRPSLWPLWLVGLAIAGLFGVTAMTGQGASPLAEARDGERASITDPLDLAAVQAGIDEARRLARTGDERTLAEGSRDCHRQLRSRPTIAQLDRCSAFDDTVVQIQDRDPLRDEGPFSTFAVTSRKLVGAAALSSDSLAIDSRLDRIRLAVELALAPPAPPPSTAPSGENAELIEETR